MLLEHASYDYPSHLVPLLDLALTLLALAPLLLPRRREGSVLRRLGRAARRASRSTPRLLCGLFVLGVAASAGIELAIGPPLPAVVDEISYLHAAETFARGELTRPAHPHQAHFEAMHVLQAPTVQSKYPPAQGLFLAVGARLGHPSAALWLLAGLLAAGVAWFLGLWLPPPWPLVGALAVLLRVGIGSYWNQSYWGGTLAALGALLLLGGLRRALERPDPRPALVLAAGVLLLANTRPFEGLLFALAPAAVLGLWLLGRKDGVPLSVRWTRVGLPALFVLLAGGAAMAIYHRAVTGDPLVFPHSLYTEQAMPGVRHFLYPPPATDGVEPGGGWVGRALGLGVSRLAVGVQFQVGLLGGFLALLALPRLQRDPWLALGTISAGLVAAGHFLTRPWHVHYAAPVLPVLALLAVVGLRHATLLARRRHRSGRWLPAAFVGLQLVLCLVQLPAHRVDADHPARQRQAVERFLLEQPGDDLVILEVSPLLVDEWLWNAADPDSAPVVWARQLSERENAALRDHYRDRHTWYLDIRRDGVVLHRDGADGPVAFSTTG